MRTRKASGRKHGTTGKTVRFGVIGVGGMGTGHCKAVSMVRRARLAAVCDANRAKAETVGMQFGVPCFNDHRQLIKSGLCDAVIIATPHPLHPRPAIDCMNAGIHVLSEKPLSERVSTADKMVKAARKNGVVFAVNFQLRHQPAVIKAMNLIKNGDIGSIYRTVMISPEYRSQSYYDSGAWRATWIGEGGGVMMNQSPHLMDLFVQLCGMPCEVYGRVETKLHKIEVEDHAEALLKYPNGATGYLYCSTNERGTRTIEVIGDKGKLVLAGGELSFCKIKPGIKQHIAAKDKMWAAPKVVEVPVRIGKPKRGSGGVIQNMVASILSGEPLVTSGESGIKSLELANAIMLSSSENRWIKLPISRARYDRYLAELRKNSKFAKKTGNH